jgi:OmpA-OmpF porin, OOP family
MTRILFAVTSAAAMALALPALAQTSDGGRGGLYVGGTVGQSEFKDGCADLPSGASCDEKDTAWRLLAGYQLNRWLAAEVGYHDLGKIDGSALGVNAGVEAKALELVGVGTLPIGSQFGLYGKLGGYRGETKLSSNVGVSGKDTNNGLTFGAGLQWDALRNVGLRLEWQRYNDIGGDDSAKGDIDVVSVGAIWRFR